MGLLLGPICKSALPVIQSSTNILSSEYMICIDNPNPISLKIFGKLVILTWYQILVWWGIVFIEPSNKLTCKPTMEATYESGWCTKNPNPTRLNF